MTIDIKVNGTMVGFLYLHNEGAIVSDHRYTYEYYRPTQHLIKGEVIHRRDDGAEILIHKTLADILNKIGEK